MRQPAKQSSTSGRLKHPYRNCMLFMVPSADALLSTKSNFWRSGCGACRQYAPVPVPSCLASCPASPARQPASCCCLESCALKCPLELGHLQKVWPCPEGCSCALKVPASVNDRCESHACYAADSVLLLPQNHFSFAFLASNGSGSKQTCYARLIGIGPAGQQILIACLETLGLMWNSVF